ncbi:MAG: hypothetical protein WCO78_03145 [Candidatus Roizmanbacteria bacterium]
MKHSSNSKPSAYQRYFNTVTPLSKILTAVVFIVLPVITFYIGLYLGMTR